MSQALPLRDCRVMLTRAESQADPLRKCLESLGASVLLFPAIEIRPVEVDQPYDPAAYDWIVFGSANAVRHFFDSMGEPMRRAPQPEGARVAAVGSATAEAVRAWGWRVEVVPEAQIAEALAAAIVEADPEIAGKRILLPRGNLSRSVATEALRRAGADVHDPVVYETRCPEVSGEQLAALDAFHPNVAVFTSPSIVRNFAALAGSERVARLKASCRFVAIGPVTAEAAEAAGLFPAIEAKEYGEGGLVDAVLAASRGVRP